MMRNFLTLENFNLYLGASQWRLKKQRGAFREVRKYLE